METLKCERVEVLWEEEGEEEGARVREDIGAAGGCGETVRANSCACHVFFYQSIHDNGAHDSSTDVPSKSAQNGSVLSRRRKDRKHLCEQATVILVTHTHTHTHLDQGSSVKISLHSAPWTQTEQRLWNAPCDVSQPLIKTCTLRRALISLVPSLMIKMYVGSGRCRLRYCTLTQ